MRCLHYGLRSVCYWLILLWSDEFVTLAVDVDDFNLVIILEVLAQLGDIDIH